MSTDYDLTTPPASPNDSTLGSAQSKDASKKTPKGTYQWFLVQALDKQIAVLSKSVEALRVAKTDYPRAIPFAITSGVDQRLDFKATIRGVVNFTPFLGPYGNWQSANLDSVSNCLSNTPIAISQMISIATR
jgi:hypothetical protein